MAPITAASKERPFEVIFWPPTRHALSSVSDSPVDCGGDERNAAAVGLSQADSMPPLKFVAKTAQLYNYFRLFTRGCV